MSAAKKDVVDRVLDPTSVLFRNTQIAEKPACKGELQCLVVCGEVNAKNRSGAFVGFRMFLATRDDAAWDVDFADADEPYPLAFVRQCGVNFLVLNARDLSARLKG